MGTAPGGEVCSARPGLASALQGPRLRQAPRLGPATPGTSRGVTLSRPSRHQPGAARARRHLKKGGGPSPHGGPPRPKEEVSLPQPPREEPRRAALTSPQVEPLLSRPSLRGQVPGCSRPAPAPPPHPSPSAHLPRACGVRRAPARAACPPPPAGQPPGRAPEGGLGRRARERTCPRRRRARVSGRRRAGGSERGADGGRCLRRPDGFLRAGSVGERASRDGRGGGGLSPPEG